MMEQLEKYGVKVLRHVTAEEITDEGLVISTGEGIVTVPTDSVMMAAGLTPNLAKAEELRTCAPVFQSYPGTVIAPELFRVIKSG